MSQEKLINVAMEETSIKKIMKAIREKKPELLIIKKFPYYYAKYITFFEKYSSLINKNSLGKEHKQNKKKKQPNAWSLFIKGKMKALGKPLKYCLTNEAIKKEYKSLSKEQKQNLLNHHKQTQQNHHHKQTQQNHQQNHQQ